MAHAVPPTKSFPPEYLAANESGKLVTVAVVFGVLEVLFICLFLIARLKNKTANSTDVYLMIPAFAFCFSLVVLTILQIQYGGNGRHIVAVPKNEIVIWLKIHLALLFVYPAAVALPKLSILCLYLRIFTSRPYRYAAYTIGTILIMTWIAISALAFGGCIPFAYHWDTTIKGKCVDRGPLYTWFSIPNIVTDLAMLVLPLPVVWRLQLTRNQKIGLTLSFFTGSIGIFTGIMRFVAFFTVDVFKDPTWNAVYILTWTNTEPAIYLIAACLLSLRPLFTPLFNKFNMRALRTTFVSNGSRLPSAGGTMDIAPEQRGVATNSGDLRLTGTRASQTESKDGSMDHWMRTYPGNGYIDVTATGCVSSNHPHIGGRSTNTGIMVQKTYGHY